MAAARLLAALNPGSRLPTQAVRVCALVSGLHHSHQLVHNRLMKRATMTVPDDLAEAVDNYLRAQEIPHYGSTYGGEGFYGCVGS